MSRSCKYVILGAIWTATTVLILTQTFLPATTDSSFSLGWLLVLGLCPSVVLFAATGVANSPFTRWPAVVLHLLVPVLWASQVANSAGVFFDERTFFLITFSSLIGCTFADLGLQLDHMVAPLSAAQKQEQSLQEFAQAAARPVGSFDSGGFGPILAYDSGPLNKNV
jgi:hypothetical protein